MQEVDANILKIFKALGFDGPILKAGGLPQICGQV
jgi:hypothetical protein